MSGEILRTLWSVTECTFCGRRHNQGACPSCGANRSDGEVHLVESPHIEKLRAVKQLLEQYVSDEKKRLEVRIEELRDILQIQGTGIPNLPKPPLLRTDDVKLRGKDEKEMGYIMGIVNKLLGHRFAVSCFPNSGLQEYATGGRSVKQEYLEDMLEHIEASLAVEEKLQAIVSGNNKEEVE
jgi:hypothetical protein